VARYKGRHRKPSTAGKTAARVATTGIIAAVPMGVLATPAMAASPIADAIAQCESGGSYTAQNRSSTASGKYQFINSTWKRYGGTTARARDASPAEQERVFQRAFAAEGTRPWNASKSCWQGKGGNAPQTPRKSAAPRAQVPAPTNAPVGSRGTYTCDAAHLKYELCDPANLGQKNVPYPVRKGEASKHSRGSYTCDVKHLRYELCDPATLGKTFEYPNRKR
jgi:resuscitation-promoting factor RpfA